MTSSTKPYAILLAFLLGLIPMRTSAQVTDTLTITIEGELAFAEIIYDGTARVGDTIQFVGAAYDVDGDAVTATFSWAVSDTTKMTIDPATGVAVVRAKGTVSVYLMAEAVDRFVLGAFRPEDGPAAITFPDDLQWGLFEGESLQLCGYLLNPEGYLLAHNNGNEISPCPQVFPYPFYASAGLLALFEAVRARPWREIRATGLDLLRREAGQE